MFTIIGVLYTGLFVFLGMAKISISSTSVLCYYRKTQRRLKLCLAACSSYRVVVRVVNLAVSRDDVRWCLTLLYISLLLSKRVDRHDERQFFFFCVFPPRIVFLFVERRAFF
jgi:hypothetical protein